MPGAGSGLHCRGTAPASHTCNATAMHRGAARLSRPPCPPSATEAASKKTPEAISGNHSPMDLYLSQKARLAEPSVLCCWVNPSLLQLKGGTNMGVERP